MAGDLTTLLAYFLRDLYSGTIGATSGVNVALGDGTAAAPSLAFVNQTNTGWYRSGTSDVRLSIAGSDTFIVQPNLAGVATNTGSLFLGAGADVVLTRDGAAAVLAQKNSTVAQTFRVYGTTTGPKYLSLSHDGTNGVIDTAASSGVLSLAPTNATSITTGKAMTVMSATSIPAGGTAGSGIMLSSTANFGIFFGSNTPSLSAAQGSLYLRSDGSSGSTRAYINTNGSTGWTSITTAA